METHRNIHRTRIGKDHICYRSDDRIIRLKIESNICVSLIIVHFVL